GCVEGPASRRPSARSWERRLLFAGDPPAIRVGPEGGAGVGGSWLFFRREVRPPGAGRAGALHILMGGVPAVVGAPDDMMLLLGHALGDPLDARRVLARGLAGRTTCRLTHEVPADSAGRTP